MSQELWKKEKYNFDDLCRIMTFLRSEQGCPWDREQTHESIRMNFIEEVYEAVEAIDIRDSKLLCEELGDVLLQVVFHAEMEKEKGVFTIDDVITEVCRKLIIRHPHLFESKRKEDAAAAVETWEEVKRRTKGQKTDLDAVASVARSLPALIRSEKILSRAKTTEESKKEREKVREELIQNLEKTGPRDEEEIGKLLFLTVMFARTNHVNPEQALTNATDQFVLKMAEKSREKPV